MGKTIDEKVVELRFNNSDFEKNVQQSMNTLDKLKASLNLEKSSKSLSKLGDAASSSNLSGLSKAIDTINSRFSTIGIIGQAALTRVTNAAITAGSAITNKVINPIIEGGKKRAFNIENAHFQLQGLLKDEQKVKAVMQDAMDSVDGTAYGYDVAAKAASMFASTGMEAGSKMQSSLRALAGTAAMTNSDYDSMAQIFTTVAGNGRIMARQLVQLSSYGMNAAATITNFVNEVNKGNIEVDDDIKQAVQAVHKGTNLTEADLRELVSKGKVSFDVFAAAMDNAFGEHAKKANETFNGALANINAAMSRVGAKFFSPLIEQNGMFVTLFNTIREYVNEVNKYVDPFAEKFVHVMKSMTGSLEGFFKSAKDSKNLGNNMHQFFRIFSNSIEVARHTLGYLKSAIVPIKDALKDFIPSDILTRFANFTAYLNRLTQGMKVSERTADQIKRSFKGLFATFDIGLQIFRGLATALSPLIPVFGEIGDGSRELTASFGDSIVQFDEWLKSTNTIQIYAKKVAEAIQMIIDKIKGFTSYGQSIDFSFLVDNLPIDRIKEAFGKIRNMDTGEMFNKTVDVLKAGLEKFKAAIVASEPYISSGWDKLKKVLVDIFKFIRDNFPSLGTILKGGLLYGLINALYKIGNAIGTFTKEASKIPGSINKTLGSISSAANEWKKKAQVGTFKEIATSIAILAGALWILSTINPDKMMAGLVGIGVLLGATFAFIKGMETYVKDPKGMMSSATMMLIVAAAVSILAKAVQKIGSMNLADLAKGLGAIILLIGALFGSIIAVQKSISKFDTTGRQMLATAVGLLLMAFAISQLINAVDYLGSMDLGKLIQGLSAVGVLLFELSVFITSTNFSNVGLKSKTSLVLIAGILVVLCRELERLASINTEKLIVAVAAMGALLFALSIMLGQLAKLDTNLKGSKIMASSFALVLIAGALAIMAASLIQLSKLKLMDAITGTLTMYGMLVGLMGTLNLLKEMTKSMNSGIDFIKLGAGLAAMGILVGYLVLLTVPLGIVSSLGNKAISGSIALVGLLGSLVGILYLLKDLTKTMNSGIEFAKLAMGLVAMGALVVILIGLTGPVAALGALGDKAISGVIAMGSILLVLVGTLSIINNVMQQYKNPKDFLSLGVGLVAMAAIAVILLAITPSFAALGALGFKRVIAGAIGMAAICLILVGVVGALSLLAAAFSELGPAGLAFIAVAALALIPISAALLLATMSMLILGKMKPEQFVQGVVGIIVGAIVIVGMLALLATVTAGLSIPVIIATIASIAVAALALMEVAKAMKMLGKMKPEQFAQGVVGLITSCTLLMGLLAAMAVTAPFMLIGAGVIALVAAELSAGALLLEGVMFVAAKIFDSLVSTLERIVHVFDEMQNVEPELFKAACSGVADGLRVLAEGISHFNLFAPIGAKAFLTIAEGIRTLMTPLERFQALDSDKMESDLTAIGNGMKELGHGVHEFGLLSNIGAKAFKTIAQGISYLAPGVKILSDVEGKDIGKVLVTIGVGMKYLAGGNREFGILAGIGAKAFNAIADGIGKMAPAIKTFADIGVEKTMPLLLTLGTTLAKFANALKDTPFFFVQSRAKGIGALIDNITKLSEAMPPFMDMLNQYGGSTIYYAMRQLGDAFVTFSQALNGTPWMNPAGRAEGIGTLIDNIDKLTTALPPFIEVINKYGANVDNALKTLAGGFSGFAQAITKTGWVNSEGRANAISMLVNSISTLADGITKVCDIPVKDFSTAIVEISMAFGILADGINQVNAIGAEGKGNALSTVTSGLTSLAGGIRSFITQIKDAEQFETAMGYIKTGLSTLAQGINAVFPIGAQGSANALNTLIDALPGLVDVVRDFASIEGETTKAEDILTSLGKALEDFGDAIGRTGWFKQDAKASSIGKLIDFLPNLVNAIGSFAGIADDDGSKVGNILTKLGSAMEDFGTSIRNTPFWDNESRAQGLVNVMNSMSQIADPIRNLARAVSTETIESVVHSLIIMAVGLGEAIKSFNGIGYADAAENFDAVANSFNRLAPAISALSAVATDDFNVRLSNLVNALAEFVTGTADLKGALDNFAQLGTGSADSFSNAFNTGMNKARATVVNTMIQLTTLVKRTLSQNLQSGYATMIGTSFASGLPTGIVSKEGAAKSAAEQVAKSVIKRLESSLNPDTFRKIGVNAIAGLVGGLSDKDAMKALDEAATNVANTAAKATQSGLKEKSPSKLYYQMGVFADRGLINGLLALKSKVANAGTEVANASTNGFNSVISRVTESVGNSLDFNPVITPVLDTSLISAQANRINGMFNRQTVGVAGYGNMDMNDAANLVGDKGNSYNITINAATTDANELAREFERIIVRR